MNGNKVLHIALLLLVSALMGGVFPLMKIAEQSIPPLTLAFLRALLGSLALLLVGGVLMRRKLKLLLVEWKTYVILGLLLCTFFISLSEAEERISSSLSAVLACLIPIGAFLITTVVMGWERFSLLRLAGALVAMVGVALFIGVDQIFAGGSQLAGVAIVSGGYLIYAIHIVYARLRNLDPFLAATGILIVITGLMAVAAFTMEQPLHMRASRESLLATLFLGLFSTGAAYTLFYYLVANAGAMYSATAGYLIPIFAIISGHFLISEPLNWVQAAGFGITLVGAWLVNRHPPARQS